MRLLTLWTACVLLCGLLGCSSLPHIKETPLEKLKVYSYHFGTTEYIAQEYDRNKDGLTDLISLSHRLGEKPVYYLVDQNQDGFWDIAFIDKVGLGNPADIVLYEDLTKPHELGFVNPDLPTSLHLGGKI